MDKYDLHRAGRAIVKLQITPLLLTFDEEPNIARTLAKLRWASDIVVVDSGSSDGTRGILAQYPNVRVFERKFTTHADQWTYGLEKTGIKSRWVLALDADFVLSDELVAELETLDAPASVAGYRASFIYCIDGKPLRGGIFPPVTVLYRKESARYVQDGHTQRVVVDGTLAELKGRIYHDDRKSLSRWFQSQRRYMRIEAKKILSTPFAKLRPVDRVRRALVIAPPVMLLYSLFVRGCLFDGPPGWIYAGQRTVAELILSAFMLQRLVGAGD